MISELKPLHCANCSAVLEGKFCHLCGQMDEPRVPTIRSVLGEVINALFGLESKLWRSLAALFFKPGHLTAEFLAGRRQKYTTPFRLYLLLSIVVFTYLAIAGEDAPISIGSDGTTTIEEAINESINNNGDSTKSNNSSYDRTESHAKIDAMNIEFSFLPDDLEQQLVGEIKNSLKAIVEDRAAGKTSDVINHFIEPLPKVLLIFLPVVALFFKLYFLGRGKYYLEHLVFLLHNHAYIFMLLIFTFLCVQLMSKIETLSGPSIFLIIFLWAFYTPRYMYKGIRKVYQSSRLATIFYWNIVFITYLCLLVFTAALTAVLTGLSYS